MQPHKLAFCAAAAALALGASAATAATLTFQHGVAGYAGTADTYLQGADPDFVLGAEPEVSIDASDGGLPSHTLLRFDNLFGTGAGQIAPGDIIVSAQLSVVVTSAGSGIRFHHMLTPWNEATITWNSAVGGIQTDGIEAAATPFLSIGFDDGNSNVSSGLLQLDFTSALQAMQAGSVPGYGWALLPIGPNGTNGIDFYTRDYSEVLERPLLTVQVTPVPEPASMLLALAGLAGLAGWRRFQRA